MGKYDKNGSYKSSYEPKSYGGEVVNPSLGKKKASYTPRKNVKPHHHSEDSVHTTRETPKNENRYEGIGLTLCSNPDLDRLFNEIYVMRKEIRDIAYELKDIRRELDELKHQKPKINIH